MTNRIVEFEAQLRRRRAEVLERETRQRSPERPTSFPPQKAEAVRSDGDKREPAVSGRSAD